MITASTLSNSDESAESKQALREIHVRVLRQDAPSEESYWEQFVVPYEPNMNIISVLQKIAAISKSQDGRRVSPVAWDCACLEEVCGSCAMIVNGRVRMACSSLVDKLLKENPSEIELRPLSKFPVVRDLSVDRGRLFHSLARVKAGVPVDDSYDHGPGPRISPEEQEDAYPLTTCMSCGCCMEACPQFLRLRSCSEKENQRKIWSLVNNLPMTSSFLGRMRLAKLYLSLIHISEPTRRRGIGVCGVGV